MAIWIFTLLFMVGYYFYYSYKKQQRYFEERGIPYVRGWPIVGNMGGVVFRYKHIMDVLEEICETYPDAKYIGAFNFTRPILLVRDLELVKSITIKNFDHFQNHRSFFDATVDPLMGGNLFNLHDEMWRETRNLLTPAFTSKKMKGMSELMFECGEHFVDYIEKLPEQEKKFVNTKDLFTKYTSDIIATCAFGLTVDSFKDPNNDFNVLGHKVTNIEGLQMLKFLVAGSFPRLSRLLRVKFVANDIRDFFQNIISTTIATRDEKGIHRPDMLQLMMDARGKDTKHVKIDVTMMTAQAFIFFFGGFDTTSTQMCLIAHELAINIDVQRKLQREIESVLKETNGKPTYEAINGMPYLDAVFNESMRMHTQAISIDRLCTKAFELPTSLPGGKPVTIERGMNVWITASMIHKDPRYYENPNKFDPERYYDKKVSINDVLNLGFGIGPRSCIGNRFAVFETKVLIFFLLSKFNLKANAKTSNPVKYAKGTFNIKPEGGFSLSIEPKTKAE